MLTDFGPRRLELIQPGRGGLVALASHAVMRIWSAFDFIPKALAFERKEASMISEHAA